MAAVIQLETVSKSFSAEPLLEGISCTIQAGERVALIGPNGAGKSTLLQLMNGSLEPDGGELRRQKDLRHVYTAQKFTPTAGQSVGDWLAAAWQLELPPHQRTARSDRLLRALDIDTQQELAALSGGWQKRVQLIAGLMQEPECWLLDEPTNHLDLDAVLWLQDELLQFRGTLVVISHDRYFLNQVCDRVLDVNRCYPGGLLDCSGHYDDYLEQREATLQAQQREQASLANEHRREQAWLARRPKARTTKAVSRIKRAGHIAEDLAAVQQRNQQRSLAAPGFDGSGRRTQQLLLGDGLEQRYGELLVFRDLDLQLCAGERLVLLGANGSGKTTLLDLLAGDVEPVAGALKRAHELKTLRFSQDRSQLDQQATLKHIICPDSDQVVYRGRAIHINAWLQMFLFTAQQLDQRIRNFSGGEQARILLMRMMLQQADVLLLDEPTNDLDIPAIELLEQMLIDFEGAVVLVTHDRYLMEAVGSDFLALEPGATPRRVGSYRQWEQQQRREQPTATTDADTQTDRTSAEPESGSLSWEEQKELRGIEKRVLKAEADLEAISARLDAAANSQDSSEFVRLSKAFEDAQQAVEDLYTRWQELEERIP